MAEGTSAQSRTTSFKPPTKNAWFTNDHRGDLQNVPRVSEAYVEELDVREPTVEPEAQGSGAVGVKPLSDITNEPTRDESVNSMKKLLGIGQTEALGASSRENGANEVPEMNSVTKNQTAKPVSSEPTRKPNWADEMMAEEEQMRRALEAGQEDSWRTVSSKKDKRKGGKVGESNDVSTTSEASTEHSRVNGSTHGGSVNGTLKSNESSNRFAIVDQEDDGTWEA